MQHREYKGFEIDASAIKLTSGGYGAAVKLRGGDAERTFDLPLDEALVSEDEALQEAIQYGRDLVDGLLPWFDPEAMVPRASA